MADPTIEGIILDALNRLESKVDSGFADTNAKLDSKAEKADLREIKGELRGLDSRLKQLEDDKRSRDVIKATHEERDRHFLSKRGRLWATAYAVGSLIALVFGNDIAHAVWG